MVKTLNNSRFIKTLFLFLALISILLDSENSYATKTHGRLTLGSTAITERYKTDAFGSTSNDFLIASARLFYKVTEVGDDKWEFVSDLRDKNDFFGKLNQEQLQLDNKNEFQIRQLSSRWLNPQGLWSSQMGRFQILETGSVFVDGASLEYRYSSEFKSGFFAGLNPKSIEKSYLEFDADAQQAGTYFTYQSKDRGWDENKYITHGFVQQKYKTETERTFLFQNIVYQWEADSRIINTAFFDFTPVSKFQTLNFLYQQNWSKKVNTEIAHLLIDVIEYRRQQGVLEKLEASPYNESRFEIDYLIDRNQTLKTSALYGTREIDHLTKTELNLGYNINQFISNKVDFLSQIGFRKNFTSNDIFLKCNVGYFSKAWELFADQQIEQNKNVDGTTTNPIITEIGATSFISKQFFVTGSFQRTADENVIIYSTQLRLIYRFGDQETAPLRDGAPPRGTL